VGRREERVAFWSMREGGGDGTRRDEREGGVAGKEDCFRHAPSPPWTNPPYGSCFDRDGAGSPFCFLLPSRRMSVYTRQKNRNETIRFQIRG
jgi:hypothetical protein